MRDKADIYIVIFFILWLLSNLPLYADEVYYPQGSTPLGDIHPFAGETVYPQGQPDIIKDGLPFWYYNDGTGKLDLNLRLLPEQNMVTSPTVVSPDFNHLMYTEIYIFPDTYTAVSKLYYTPIVLPKASDDGKPVTMEDILGSYQVRHEQQNRYEVLSVGTSNFRRNSFRTLTIVDWSYDSSRVLVKEHVGRMREGIFGTVVWIYDVDTDRVLRVDTVRKAIIDHWIASAGLDLNKHIWDIRILGWDKYSNNRFIVAAYLYPTKETSKFLGTWRADIRGNIVTLLSLDEENWPVDINGLIPEQD
jgi:hypothetical protein